MVLDLLLFYNMILQIDRRWYSSEFDVVLDVTRKTNIRTYNLSNGLVVIPVYKVSD